MTWLQRYRLRHYFSTSMWIMPVLSIVAAMTVVRLLHALDGVLDLRSTIGPDTARAVAGTMASSMFTFIIFVSSALLVAVQLASGQLTPRIIAIVFKDPVTVGSMTFFVFTFTLSLAALIRINDSVPIITAEVAGYSCLVSLLVFLYLIDHVGKALRPSGALRSVAQHGRRVIDHVYPLTEAKAPAGPTASGSILLQAPVQTVASTSDGVVLAFDIRGLVTLAERADCIIEMVPQVGDFVATDSPLFRIFGGKTPPPAAALLQSVAVGQERTLEQDPTLAFRIIVDIASKGLSPAINDPTTAVLAIDQLHNLLGLVGKRQLADGHVRDRAGRLRLIYRTPDWEDFVHLAVTEIRHFGGTSIQVARRLRAMLENLIQTLPESHAGLLRQELKLLNRSADRFFVEPEDRAMAEVSDFQGVGGKKGRGPDGKLSNTEVPRS
jgi:uncharacterized membrane protein